MSAKNAVGYNHACQNQRYGGSAARAARS